MIVNSESNYNDALFVARFSNEHLSRFAIRGNRNPPEIQADDPHGQESTKAKRKIDLNVQWPLTDKTTSRDLAGFGAWEIGRTRAGSTDVLGRED